MTVVVPGSDAGGTQLQGQINDINALITNNPLDLGLANQLVSVQLELCQYLLGNGGLVPSQVLSNATYGGG